MQGHKHLILSIKWAFQKRSTPCSSVISREASDRLRRGIEQSNGLNKN